MGVRWAPGDDVAATTQYKSQLDVLYQRGYYDAHQNVDALERSKGRIDKAVALIKQGIVPDIEQGYEAGVAVDSTGFTWRNEFSVTRVQHGCKSGVDVRMCINREGVACWPREGGDAICKVTWGNIRTFSLSKNHGSVSLVTADSSIDITLRDSQKIMDTVLSMAKKIDTVQSCGLDARHDARQR